MEAQKQVMETTARVEPALMEKVHAKAASLAGARSASEPLPEKNLALVFQAGQRRVVCSGCGYGFSRGYTASKPGAVSHHFCFRLRGQQIPPGCRGIISSYLLKYITKSWDAIYEESKALNSKDRLAALESSAPSSPSRKDKRSSSTPATPSRKVSRSTPSTPSRK
jgi:hypothetical protein